MKLKQSKQELLQQYSELKELEKRRKRVNPLEWFIPLPMQEKFGNDNAKTKNVFGGNRSSKTYAGTEYVITKCLAAPNQRWWAVAESFSDSVNIQQRKIWELIPKNRIKYGNYNPITGFPNRKLLFDNGSIIIFKSYDQGREAFQGDDVDGIWNDEEPPYDIYKEQRMRLMDRDGEMIITMTSVNGVTDLIEDVFQDHTVIESQYAPLVKKELPRIVEKDGMKFYLFWTPENPYINQERVAKEARLMTPDEILGRIYGMPINLSGKIYMKFSKHIHVIPFEDVPLKDCTIYHVLDPHDRKPWAMIWAAVHKTGKIYIFEEYPNRDFNSMLYDDKTYADYTKIISDTERNIFEVFGQTVIDRRNRIIDPNYGNSTIKLAERQGGQSKTTCKKRLEGFGFHFKDGIDKIEDGHLKVRELLHWEQKDNELIVAPGMYVTENCHNTIKHLSRYARKDIIATDGDVKDKAKLMEKYKDFSDVTRYLAMANPTWIGELKEFKPETHKAY